MTSHLKTNQMITIVLSLIITTLIAPHANAQAGRYRMRIDTSRSAGQETTADDSSPVNTFDVSGAFTMVIEQVDRPTLWDWPDPPVGTDLPILPDDFPGTVIPIDGCPIVVDPGIDPWDNDFFDITTTWSVRFESIDAPLEASLASMLSQARGVYNEQTGDITPERVLLDLWFDTLQPPGISGNFDGQQLQLELTQNWFSINQEPDLWDSMFGSDIRSAAGLTATERKLSIVATVIPEPATLCVLSMSLSTLAFRGRRHGDGCARRV